MDAALRRLCGWTHRRDVPGGPAFSRAFREFAGMRLAERAHAAVTGRTPGSRSVHEGHDEPGPDRVIGHVSRDSTAIPARETPAKRTKPPKAKKKRGRPKKGEERPPKPETRLRRQLRMSVPEMLEDLPKARGWSCKRNSMGKTETWKGWKRRTGTAGGGAPAGFILAPAPVRGSQAAIPPAVMTAGRITHLYELMDPACDAPEIRERIKDLGRRHITGRNPRRDSALKQAVRDEAAARRLLNHPSGGRPAIPRAVRRGARERAPEGRVRRARHMGAGP